MRRMLAASATITLTIGSEVEVGYAGSMGSRIDARFDAAASSAAPPEPEDAAQRAADEAGARSAAEFEAVLQAAADKRRRRTRPRGRRRQTLGRRRRSGRDGGIGWRRTCGTSRRRRRRRRRRWRRRQRRRRRSRLPRRRRSSRRRPRRPPRRVAPSRPRNCRRSSGAWLLEAALSSLGGAVAADSARQRGSHGWAARTANAACKSCARLPFCSLTCALHVPCACLRFCLTKIKVYAVAATCGRVACAYDVARTFSYT